MQGDKGGGISKIFDKIFAAQGLHHTRALRNPRGQGGVGGGGHLVAGEDAGGHLGGGFERAQQARVAHEHLPPPGPIRQPHPSQDNHIFSRSKASADVRMG